MQDAQTAETTALPFRGDTILGVCEALGQDFHLPANLLRIGFAALFFWSMTIGIATYLAIGAVIALARWLHPARRIAVPASDSIATDEASEVEELPIAA